MESGERKRIKKLNWFWNRRGKEGLEIGMKSLVKRSRRRERATVLFSVWS